MSAKDPSIPDDDQLDSRDVVGANEDPHGDRREPVSSSQEDDPEGGGTIALDIEGPGENSPAESSAAKNSAIEKIGDRHHAQLSDGDTPQDRATDRSG